jgi:hypothetical protein
LLGTDLKLLTASPFFGEADCYCNKIIAVSGAGNHMRSVKILGTTVALLTALLVLGPAMTLAEAGQDRYRSHRYENPDYPRGSYGWRGMRLFGFGYGKRCDELLRKAIQIDTPDPRYWNAYDTCIGL